MPGRGFDAVFPFIKLPDLTPNLNGDWVQFGSPDLEPNRLYYGDNLHVLRTLPSNSIDLIYIYPPFFSGSDYNVIWGDTNEVRTFSDIWEGGLDSYLIWLNARLWEMRRVLKSTGSIYVHCDWHASHYIKAELDKIFGYESFRNEVIWKRTSAHNDPRRFGSIHDVLFYYVKGKPKWNPQHSRDEESYFKAHDFMTDGDGRRYRLRDVTARDHGSVAAGLRYEWHGLTPPPGRTWTMLKDKMDGLYDAGVIILNKKGFPRMKRYVDELPGVPLQDIWTDIGLNSAAHERIGYPTQKPEALLERLVLASTDPDDLVADFFCGGGVTAAVAQKLNRRWIACDSSRVAVSVTLTRLVRVCEEQSGVTSNYGQAGQAQQKMNLPAKLKQTNCTINLKPNTKKPCLRP